MVARGDLGVELPLEYARPSEADYSCRTPGREARGGGDPDARVHDYERDADTC